VAAFTGNISSRSRGDDPGYRGRFCARLWLIKIVNVAGSRATPRANRLFKLLQVFSSVGLVLAYGANDADRIADAADIIENIIIKDM
jgi:phosphate/sulfate permease